MLQLFILWTSSVLVNPIETHLAVPPHVTGPTEQSMERFWRMVWEYQLTTIVMLTRCVEDGKVSYQRISFYC